MARPVVATDVGPSAELLGDRAGLVVPPRVAPLAEALRSVLTSPEQAAALGKAGRQRVEARFSLDRQVAEMGAVYAEAASVGA